MEQKKENEVRISRLIILLILIFADNNSTSELLVERGLFVSDVATTQKMIKGKKHQRYPKRGKRWSNDKKSKKSVTKTIINCAKLWQGDGLPSLHMLHIYIYTYTNTHIVNPMST